MPIKVSWDNPQKSIIRSVFDEVWTLDDYHKMIDDMHRLSPRTSYFETLKSIVALLDYKPNKKLDK